MVVILAALLLFPPDLIVPAWSSYIFKKLNGPEALPPPDNGAPSSLKTPMS